MTKDEYRGLTKIRDESEAQELLTKTKMLFAAVFTVMFTLWVVTIVFAYRVNPFAYFGYVALFAYLVYHCSRVIKLTQPVTKAWLAWAIIFVPISWIWFYPSLVNPLKIILGTIDPPEKFEPPKILSEEERKQMQKRAWRKTIRTIGLATLIAIVFMVLLTLALTFLGVEE